MKQISKNKTLKKKMVSHLWNNMEHYSQIKGTVLQTI